MLDKGENKHRVDYMMSEGSAKLIIKSIVSCMCRSIVQLLYCMLMMAIWFLMVGMRKSCEANLFSSARE